MTKPLQAKGSYRDRATTHGDSLTVSKGESALVTPTLSQAISQSLKRLQERHGYKNLPALFDGREGKEVAETTVNRWGTEPHRMPAVMLPALVEADPEFRSYLFEMLAARMTTPANLVGQLSAGAAQEVQDAITRSIVGPLFGESATRKRGN